MNCDMESFLLRINRKLRIKGFSNLFNDSSCPHFEIVKMGIVSSESRPDAFMRGGVTIHALGGIPSTGEHYIFS